MTASADAPTRLYGLALGPVVFAAVLLWPMAGLSREAHVLAAVFAWTVAYWVTEALPVAASRARRACGR